MGLCSIHRGAITRRGTKPLLCIMGLKMIYLKLPPHRPESNEVTQPSLRPGWTKIEMNLQVITLPVFSFDIWMLTKFLLNEILFSLNTSVKYTIFKHISVNSKLIWINCNTLGVWPMSYTAPPDIQGPCILFMAATCEQLLWVTSVIVIAVN